MEVVVAYRQIRESMRDGLESPARVIPNGGPSDNIGLPPPLAALASEYTAPGTWRIEDGEGSFFGAGPSEEGGAPRRQPGYVNRQPSERTLRNGREKRQPCPTPGWCMHPTAPAESEEHLATSVVAGFGGCSRFRYWCLRGCGLSRQAPVLTPWAGAVMLRAAALRRRTIWSGRGAQPASSRRDREAAQYGWLRAVVLSGHRLTGRSALSRPSAAAAVGRRSVFRADLPARRHTRLPARVADR